MTKTHLMYTFGILKDSDPGLATKQNLKDRLAPGVYSCSTFPSHKQVLLTTLHGLVNDNVYQVQQDELNERLNEVAGASVIPMAKQERVERAWEIRVELGFPPLVDTGVFRIMEGE